MKMAIESIFFLVELPGFGFPPWVWQISTFSGITSLFYKDSVDFRTYDNFRYNNFDEPKAK